MKFNGTLLGQASGSLAGTTFSHNRGGQYTRKRSTPTNPNTTFQQAVRSAVGQLTSLWLNTLTTAQREAWDTYASNVLIPDTLGEPRNIGGLGQYVRSNVPRLQAALPRVDDGPTIFNLGDFTAPAIASLTAATGIYSITFTAADDWANEDDAAMLFLTSRGQNASINYFKGPYRFAGTIDGDSTTPPTSPASITSAFTVAVGQKGFIQARVSRADGRLSAPFRSVIVAV